MAWRMSRDLRGKLFLPTDLPLPRGRHPDRAGRRVPRGSSFSASSDGSLDDTDLSGVNFALCNHLPVEPHLRQLERGDRRRRGGLRRAGRAPWSASARARRAAHSATSPTSTATTSAPSATRSRFSDGDRPSASVGSRARCTFEPLAGPGGHRRRSRARCSASLPNTGSARRPGKSDRFGIELRADLRRDRGLRVRDRAWPKTPRRAASRPSARAPWSPRPYGARRPCPG